MVGEAGGGMGEGGTQTLTDGDILALFQEDPAFRAALAAWNAGQRKSFCAVARTVHDAGLDWWYVKIQPWQLRFGRKSAGRPRAEGVFGYLLGSPPRIDFNRSGIDLGLNDNMTLTSADTQRFDVTFKARGVEIRAWLPPSPPRPGRWPDELGAELADSLADNKVEERKIVTDIKPTNLILYGPPGTGKTFSTAEEAVRLCDGTLPDGGDNVATRRRYGELVKARQVQFVTFHQSYSYEDFVEGLRPTTGEGEEDTAATAGGFRLEPIAGVFREIATLAEQARKAAAKGGRGTDFNLADRRFWKMGLGAIGSEEHVYNAAIAGGYVALGWGADIDWSDPRFESLAAMQAEWASRYHEDKKPSQTAQPWALRNRVGVDDLVIVPYGNSAFRAIAEVTGDYYFELSEDGTFNQRRKVRWLLKLDEPLPLDTIIDGNFTMRTLYMIPEHRIRKEALTRLLSSPDEVSGPTSPDQFVLIIDEINRANISKVFGELITLIEPDKRIGGEYEIKATLPYSKISFGVPDNLHIIGTMNTADRSVALLDTAIRRRFAFRELMPQPELLSTVDGIDLQQLLATINDRIEYLFDREHQIGHGFFMGCKSRADVDDVMRRKVIPLLSEYFYEDWNKVAAVLGDADDRDGNRDGGFLDRRQLKAPVGLGGEDDPAPRYRWQARTTFNYGKLQ